MVTRKVFYFVMFGREEDFLGSFILEKGKCKWQMASGNENGNGSGNAAEMNAMVNDLVSTFPSLIDQGYGSARRMAKALRDQMNE